MQSNENTKNIKVCKKLHSLTFRYKALIFLFKAELYMRMKSEFLDLLLENLFNWRVI